MLRCAISHKKVRIIGSCMGIALAMCSFTSMASAQWPQWGGKNRDFVADAKDLAAVWPEGGPKKIWSRPIGPGYSSICFEDGRLYTMYREPDAENADDSMGPVVRSLVKDEIVVALDAQTGNIAWEYKYSAPWTEAMDTDNLKGPNATPLVHGGKVYTFGVTGKLHCLDQKSGKLVWSHDVRAEFGAKMPGFGFASSPVVYKNSLILPVGGPGVGVMAFDLATGAVQWKKHDFVKTYSSPILIRIDGADELVLLAGDEVVGMTPASGDIEWRYPFESNVTTPLWGDDGILFISSADYGSRALKLTRKDGKVNVEELWTTKLMKVGFTNAVRVGNVVFGSSAEHDEYFMTALEAATGRIAWREGGFKMGNVVYADGKLIIMEKGWLAIATATPGGFELKSKVPSLQKSEWMNPTIVGQRLFVRDHQEIVALDISH